MSDELNELEKFLCEDSELILLFVFNTIREDWVKDYDVASKCTFAESKQKVYDAINSLYSKNLLEKNGSEYKLSTKGMELAKNASK